MFRFIVSPPDKRKGEKQKEQNRAEIDGGRKFDDSVGEIFHGQYLLCIMFAYFRVLPEMQQSIKLNSRIIEAG